MNTPLIGRVKIALKRARLGISKANVSEVGDLSLFLFAGNDDNMFVSSTFDDTDVIVLRTGVKSRHPGGMAMVSTTRWFFDTEFIDTGSVIDLISIGIVSEDGLRSYSACLSGDWETTMPEWQLKNVLPHLPPPEARIHSRQQVADEILKLVGEGQPEFWAYFASYDWVALCQLVTNGGRMIDLPKHWPKFVCDLKMLMHLLRVEKRSLPARPEDGKHDALSDARWARDTYLYLQEKKSRLMTDSSWISENG
jgi:hypothetical protein